MSLYHIFLLGFVIGTAPDASARSVTYTWDGGGTDANWTTSQNWRTDQAADPPNGAYPGFDGQSATTNDKAVVPAGGEIAVNISPTIGALDLGEDLFLTGKTLTITRRDGLVIRPSASLFIESNAKLRLTGATGSGEHTIDGVIELQTSTSDLEVDRDTGSACAVLGGDGFIIGGSSEAAVFVAGSGDILVSKIPITGGGVFHGAGTFDNRGGVTAEGLNVAFGGSLSLADDEPDAPRWQVFAGGTMTFLRSATLLGRFQAGFSGVFVFGTAVHDVDVVTEGQLHDLDLTPDTEVHCASCSQCVIISGQGSSLTWLDSEMVEITCCCPD